jgi:hypothetical protein
VVILGLEVFAQRGNFGDYVWTPDILGRSIASVKISFWDSLV